MLQILIAPCQHATTVANVQLKSLWNSVKLPSLVLRSGYVLKSRVDEMSGQRKLSLYIVHAQECHVAFGIEEFILLKKTSIELPQ